eukprot:5262857-Alexandrium_andersonii.AAC.1
MGGHEPEEATGLLDAGQLPARRAAPHIRRLTRTTLVGGTRLPKTADTYALQFQAVVGDVKQFQACLFTAKRREALSGVFSHWLNMSWNA